MKQHKEYRCSKKATAIKAKDKAILCARLALEKKAYDVRILQIGVLSSIAEYFMICSGRSVRQVRAITEHIQFTLKDYQQHPLGVEGEEEGIWILLDYEDVIVHVFYEPTREVYRLERLWSEAPLLRDPELEEQEKVTVPQDKEEMEDWDD
jgi:ribosome-associated protein